MIGGKRRSHRRARDNLSINHPGSLRHFAKAHERDLWRIDDSEYRLDALLTQIGDALRATRSSLRLLVPYERGGVLSRVYARGRVLRREDRSDGICLDVEIPRALEGLVLPYRISGTDGAGARGPARPSRPA